MKFILATAFFFLITTKMGAQTHQKIVAHKIKQITSYDQDTKDNKIKYDTIIEVFDTLGYSIREFRTRGLRYTNVYIHVFDSLKREIQCKQVSENKTYLVYKTIYKPDGGFFRIYSENTSFEERREYNKQEIEISSFSDIDKHKTIFTLDSLNNYFQITTIYSNKPDQIKRYNLSYDKSGNLVKRSALSADGSEMIFEYNDLGLVSKTIFYPKKRDKTWKTIRVTTYEFY
ncbi:MAG: hypothetical protein QM764_18140 [Chitinophagaceae bacterium]